MRALVTCNIAKRRDIASAQILEVHLPPRTNRCVPSGLLSGGGLAIADHDWCHRAAADCAAVAATPLAACAAPLEAQADRPGTSLPQAPAAVERRAAASAATTAVPTACSTQRRVVVR